MRSHGFPLYSEWLTEWSYRGGGFPAAANTPTKKPDSLGLTPYGNTVDESTEFSGERVLPGRSNSRLQKLTSYGRAVPDLDFTRAASTASMKPSAFTSSRKLEFVTGLPDWDLVWATSTASAN